MGLDESPRLAHFRHHGIGRDVEFRQSVLVVFAIVDEIVVVETAPGALVENHLVKASCPKGVAEPVGVGHIVVVHHHGLHAVVDVEYHCVFVLSVQHQEPARRIHVHGRVRLFDVLAEVLAGGTHYLRLRAFCAEAVNAVAVDIEVEVFAMSRHSLDGSEDFIGVEERSAVGRPCAGVDAPDLPGVSGERLVRVVRHPGYLVRHGDMCEFLRHLLRLGARKRRQECHQHRNEPGRESERHSSVHSAL